MSTKYRFSINGHFVNPIYKDDLAKEYELESEQRFYRAKLSGSLVFIRDDFDWLDAQTTQTEFELLIERELSGVWSNYWMGSFYKTDGSWDDDNKRVEVKVDVKDEYTEVLAGINNEYNLIKLAPKKTPLQIQKRPLIQVYIPGDSVVSCFLGGNYWEQDVAFEEDDASVLINTYYFAKASTLHKIFVAGTGLPQGCVGDYVTEGELLAENPAVFYGRNNVYKIEYTPGAANPGGYPFTLKIIRVSDLEEMFTYSGNTDMDNLPLDTNFELTKVSTEASGTLSAIWTQIDVYMRYLLDVETILGLNTNLIPSNDLVNNNRNYRRAIGYAIDQITITTSASITATKYGLMDDGYYFNEPPGFPTYYKYFPVARSTWGFSSIWFNFDILDESLEIEGRKAYILKDSMLISDAIKVLLNEIDPTISHDTTAEYSEFLNGTTNPITLGQFRVMITQKSNILAGEYDQPAQKAPTSLSSIMAMLRDTMKLYWYIEDSKFKIEHILWFKNGGSYSSTSLYTADLTTMMNHKNAKRWGLYTSNYEYEKQDLAERIEFAWMDDVTEGFEGFPIEINSKFVTRGKKDDINIGEFTSDIDYMLLNPGAINEDGFALFGAIESNKFDINDDDIAIGYFVNYTNGNLQANATYNATGFIPVVEGEIYTMSYKHQIAWYDIDKNYISGSSSVDTNKTQIAPVGASYVRCTVIATQWTDFKIVYGVFIDLMELPFIERIIDDADLRLQNGLMSWIYLQPNFWVYDLPASDVIINESEFVTVYGIERKKKQTVRYPSIEDPDPYKLVKTYLGDGQIDKLSINLQSRMNEIQLKYDTE